MSAVAQFALAPDRVVPQRDVLLDIAAVGRLLSAQLGADGPIRIDKCERLRTKYRAGDSLRVLYRVHSRASTCIVAARTFLPGQSEAAYARSMFSGIPYGPLRSVFRDSELETVFWTFPNDRKIKDLDVLVNVPRELAKLVPGSWTQSQLVAYAPEKCATARCLDKQGRVLAYAKVYGDTEGKHFHQTYNAISRTLDSSGSSVRIPRALAYCDLHRTLLLEAIPGMRIADLCRKELLHGIRRLGAALAQLHRLAVPKGLPRFERLDVAHLHRAVWVIAMVCPAAASIAARACERLCSEWQAPGKSVCLHGDVHPKNGIVFENAISLVDLDQAGTGPAVADLGSFLAALRYNRHVGFLSASTEHTLAAAFLSGYSSIAELPETSILRWHTAAAMLAERALRAVNRIREEGLEHLQDLLADCERLLGERPHD
jgi:Ser/Thr protein kinase RdoA (MazF antagonist)